MRLTPALTLRDHLPRSWNSTFGNSSSDVVRLMSYNANFSSYLSPPPAGITLSRCNAASASATACVLAVRRAPRARGSGLSAQCSVLGANLLMSINRR